MSIHLLYSFSGIVFSCNASALANALCACCALVMAATLCSCTYLHCSSIGRSSSQPWLVLTMHCRTCIALYNASRKPEISAFSVICRLPGLAHSVLSRSSGYISASILHTFSFFHFSFSRKKIASLRSWGWTDSSERWWWFRICNRNHSLSFTSPNLFSIEIHHFHQVSPFCHFHSCGWPICARLTKPQVRLCDNRDNSPSLSSCDIARPVDKLKRGRLRYVNPTLWPTLCQLFAGSSCANLRIHKTRRSLATYHYLLAIHR